MDGIENPEWSDRQHCFQNALHILKNNPDDEEIQDAVELLELADSCKEIK